jgi:hypothetical protein
MHWPWGRLAQHSILFTPIWVQYAFTPGWVHYFTHSEVDVLRYSLQSGCSITCTWRWVNYSMHSGVHVPWHTLRSDCTIAYPLYWTHCAYNRQIPWPLVFLIYRNILSLCSQLQRNQRRITIERASIYCVLCRLWVWAKCYLCRKFASIFSAPLPVYMFLFKGHIAVSGVI